MIQASHQAPERADRPSIVSLATHVVGTLPVSVLLLDTDGAVIDANARCLSQCRFRIDELVGRSFSELFVEPGPIGTIDRNHRAPWLHARASVLNLVTRTGQEIPCVVDVQPLSTGAFTGWVVTAVDVTDQKIAETRLHLLAHSDSLTRLPNRQGLWDFMDEANAHTRQIGLILIDIRAFSVINDCFGHDVGDDLLARFGTRLRQLADTEDYVARVGGDQFAIACRVDDCDGLLAYAERLAASLNGTALVRQIPLQIDTRMGLALLDANANTARELIRAADVALSRAKQGQEPIVRFEESMLDAVQQRARLDGRLRHAIRDGELFPVFHPIVDLASRRTIGAEMLVRWDHPSDGILLPGDFLGHADESGTIVQVDLLMLRAALEATRGSAFPVPVNVNLSGVTLASTALWRGEDGAGSLLDELDPARVQLEVTESFLIADGSVAEARVHELAERGFRIYLDDFGTGYASLNYLQRLPIVGLKIDRHFMAKLTSNDREQSIVRSLIDLSRSLDLAVVAEGIETEDQLACLRDMGCPAGQGFLFSRPERLEDVTRQLDAAKMETTA